MLLADMKIELKISKIDIKLKYVHFWKEKHKRILKFFQKSTKKNLKRVIPVLKRGKII